MPLPSSVFSPEAVDRRVRTLAALAILIIAAARIVSLLANRTDLYVDEAQYWVWAQSLDWGYFSKPPLIALVIRATTGLFGDGEAAVRLAAPVLHALTALVVGHIGARLYGGRVGALAAIVYATLPAVALSSTLISTDVPLMLFWSLGLAAAIRHGETGSLASAAGLGAAIAVGLNAKYAMGYLVPVVLLAFAVDPVLRARLLGWRLFAGLAIGLVGLLPNLLWNAAHGWVTLHHTGDNAGWGRHGLDVGSMADFVGTQFGVFGPVGLVLMLAAAAGRVATGHRRADRLLVLASVPILAAISIQALVAEANANWAATAYPAGSVLVAALIAAPGRVIARRLVLGTGAAASLVLIVAPAFAPDLRLPVIGRPFERILGWQAYGEAVAAAAEAAGAKTILAHRRADAAELLYVLRDTGLGVAVPVAAGAPPRDHFQMTIPFRPSLPDPGLAVGEGTINLPAGVRTVGEATRIAVNRGVAKSLSITLQPVTW